MTDARALYLFSSNIRPLYEQDVLNVLAAPAGLSYRFRYRKGYLSPELAEAWDNETLKDRTCIIHFSLQQPNQYHDAVLFPVRLGSVTRATREAGDIYLVEFTVDRSVSLVRPDVPPTSDSAATARAYRRRVDDYRDFLTQRKVLFPYDASASFGPNIAEDASAPIEVGAGEGFLFQRSTEFLAGTSSYQNAKFFRILRLERRDGMTPTEVTFTPGTGYRLTSSRAYQLVVLHSQPRDVTSRSAFAVSADQNIAHVVGRQGFEMASKYDVASIPMIAADLPGANAREGVLEIAPEHGVQGPILTLPLRLEPEALKTTGAVGASMVGLFLVGLTGIVSSTQPQVAIGALIAGTALATLVPLVMTGRTPWSG
jgi:hypothetical protein